MAISREFSIRPRDWIDATSDIRGEAFSNYDPEAVVALMDSFLNEDEETPDAQEASLVALMRAIDEDRGGARQIFPGR